MKLISSLKHRIRSGWLAALATAAVVALASPTDAQTVPPPPASALSSADLAKVHLTAARNALSDVTQLPAAAQLTGETRTRVQQLISFNELIGKKTTGASPMRRWSQSLDAARERGAGARDGHAECRGDERRGGGS